MLMNSVQPCMRAVYSAFENCQAYMLDAPIYRGLAGLDHVVQGLQRFFERCGRVPAMDLVQVDVIGAEAAQAVIDLGHDVLARQARTVGGLCACGRVPWWQ